MRRREGPKMGPPRDLSRLCSDPLCLGLDTAGGCVHLSPELLFTRQLAWLGELD